jgi:hypothetical protein
MGRVMNDSYSDITWMSEQAARFRSLAELEPIAALRRHLTALARQYEQFVADLKPKARD